MTPERLREGVRTFQAAALDSTYTQSKNALVQALCHLRHRQPDLVEPFFREIAPWFEARAKELPEAQRAKELRQLREGTLEVTVSIPIPKDVLEQVAVAQREAVEKLHADMMVADLRAEQAIRSQAAQRRVEVQAGQAEPDVKSTRSAKSAGVRAKAPLSDTQWGAFLGRLISHATSKAEDQALELLAHKGRVDQALVGAMKISGVLDDIPNGAEWIGRVSAGIRLAERCRYSATNDGADRLAIDTILASDSTPSMAYSPLQSSRDGDLEGLLLRWISTATPGLARAVLDNHPHFPRPAQLRAVNAQLDQIVEREGRVLEGFNVLTIMHQMGRTVPWLELLHDKLGLKKEDYLGVSVPYSGSKLAEAKLNRDGFETVADHDPRPELLARMQDTLGGGQAQSFDELKEQDIKRAVGRMVEKHQANGKPILIVDDGGYAAKVIRKHFPEREDQFRIVEWTTRGIRQFEQIPQPKMSLISAAESRPKVEVEPAFIADSLVEHFQVALRQRFPDLKDKRILVIGAGNIGRACALAAQELGATVSMNDLKPERLSRAVAGTKLTGEADIRKAVTGKDAILAVTGANSLPDEIFSLIDPGTVVASASSVDIETRSESPHENGHWSTDLSRLSITMGADEKSKGQRAAFKNQVTEGGVRALEVSLNRSAAAYGLEARVERRDILAGGFVLNLSRKARVMPIQREELILLNVTEAMAQATQTTMPGKHLMESAREDRILSLFERYHPEDFAAARRFSKR